MIFRVQVVFDRLEDFCEDSVPRVCGVCVEALDGLLGLFGVAASDEGLTYRGQRVQQLWERVADGPAPADKGQGCQGQGADQMFAGNTEECQQLLQNVTAKCFILIIHRSRTF